MGRFYKTHKMILILLVAGMFVSCTSKTNDNCSDSSVRFTTDTFALQATTACTAESTTITTIEPIIEPTTTETTTPTIAPTTTPKEKDFSKETTPPATNPTNPTCGSTNNRKTLYGYDTTTGRTVPGEVESGHAGYADLEKLVAWDGVSPLIFIYSDGTVGTEPREGAQYESKPYILTTYVVYRDASGRVAGDICKHCGKEVEAVTHKPNNRVDYCTHYSFNRYCVYCGKWVAGYDCHDCINYFDGIFYCSDCGRISGNDGSNGKCVSWMTDGNHTCPACGATVPGHTCHTCNEE